MPDLLWLADLGRASVAALWVPVGVWTAVALVAEAALRVLRPSAALALPVRGAVLAALPLAVGVPLALAALAPEAAMFAVVPDPLQWLPEVSVGATEAVGEAGGAPAGPSVLDVLLGLSVVAVAALTVAQALRLGAALAALGNTRRSLPAAAPEARDAVARACARFGVSRPVAVAQAPAGVPPFTVGVRRPLVALPADLDGEGRELAALHEVAHVRRADAFWHGAQRAVAAVFAAHPLVWVLSRGLDLDRERAADAAVLALRPDRRKAYADLLFSYAALPAPTLALGAARGSSSLKTRIDAMTSPLSPTRTRLLARLGRGVGLLALAAVVAGAAATAPSPRAAGLTFHLVAPSAEVDGRPIAPGGSLAADPFAFYTLEVDGVGRFVVSAAPFSGSSPTGSFDGTTLRAEAGGHTLVIRSAEPILRGDDAPTTAHVRFEPWPAGTPALAGAVSEGLPHSLDGLAPVGTRSPMDALLALAAPADTTEIFEVVDEMPQLIGGLAGLMERVEYPDLQARAGVEGRAIVQFVVDEQGRVVDPVVRRSTGNDGLDRAALAAVRASRFEPGTHRGQAVRVRFAVPITFQLGENAPAPLPPGPTPEVGSGEVFEVVEEQPQLVGGLAGLQGRVVYPPLARAAGIEGQVVVQFIVNEAGAVEDAVVLRSPDAMLTEAALQAVRGAEFTPGRQGGQAVKVRFAVPITFRLPAGDGVDRGEARPSPDDLRRRLPSSGTDLTLLANEAGLRARHARALSVLDDADAAAGTATVRYTLLPNGRTTDLRMATDTPDGKLGDLARGLVAMMTFEADRRPPVPYEDGVFRLDYRRP